MTITANLADGTILNFPDGTDPSVIQATVKKLITYQQTPQYRSESEIPLESEIGLPPKPKPQQPEPTFGEKVLGAGETALTMATGATGGALGYAGGVLSQLPKEIVSGEFGSAESANRVERAAMEGAQDLTYAPRTETGQEYTETLGEIAEPMVAISPQMSYLANMKPAIAVSKLKAMSPTKRKAIIKKEILAGNRDIDNIIYKVDPEGKLITNKTVKEAIKLAGNDVKGSHLALTVDGMSQETRQAVLRMIHKVEQGRKKGDEYIMMNRPVDEIGKAIAGRAIKADKIRKSANQKLNRALKTELKNVKINTSKIADELMDDLSKKGVKFTRNEEGVISIDLSNARVRLGDVLPKTELERLLNQLDGKSIKASAAHDMKQFIREFVDFDEGLQVGVKTSKTIEKSLKLAASKINEKLNSKSKTYKNANKKYATVVNSLKKVKKLLKDIDLGDDLAKSKLGALSKRIGSNLASREQIIKMVDELETALKTNNITQKDNIYQMVAAIGKIDEIFGVDQSQSPFGFVSGIAKGTASALTGDKIGAVRGGIDLLVRHGDQNNVVIETDENLQEYIITEVESGILYIYVQKNARINKSSVMDAHVTVNQLNKLKVSGGGDVQSQGLINADDISIAISGGGDLQFLLRIDGKTSIAMLFR